jgi:hypothetical protein
MTAKDSYNHRDPQLVKCARPAGRCPKSASEAREEGATLMYSLTAPASRECFSAEGKKLNGTTSALPPMSHFLSLRVHALLGTVTMSTSAFCLKIFPRPMTLSAAQCESFGVAYVAWFAGLLLDSVSTSLQLLGSFVDSTRFSPASPA